MTAAPMPSWAVLIHEYYGTYLTPPLAEFWLRELRLSDSCGPHTTEEEIVAAIRFALKKNAEGSKDAMLKKLIMWIRWYRKERRAAAQNTTGGESCGKCHDGWLDVWLALPDNPTPDDFYGGRSDHRQVPCLCSAGQQQLDTCKDFKGISHEAAEELTRLARLGMEQRKERWTDEPDKHG